MSIMNTNLSIIIDFIDYRGDKFFSIDGNKVSSVFISKSNKKGNITFHCSGCFKNYSKGDKVFLSLIKRNFSKHEIIEFEGIEVLKFEKYSIFGNLISFDLPIDKDIIKVIEMEIIDENDR